MTKNLWSAFCKMSEEEKIDFITSALNTHPDQAKSIYTDMYNHLQRMDLLKSLVHTKSDITSKDQQMLTKLKAQELKRRRKKPSKLEQKLKLHFFEIDNLRKEGVSWKNIMLYIKEEHRIRKLSESGLKKIYLRLKEILKTQSEETNKNKPKQT